MLNITCDSTLACSIIVRLSAVNPLIAHPICLSISTTFSTEADSINEDVTRFSTTNTTPSLDFTPIAVEPS